MLYHRTALILERQEFSRQALRDIMRQCGIAIVAEARNTDDGLARFERFLPDIVVLDVSAPGTDDAVLLIPRMIKLHPDTHVFATGSMSENERLMEALTRGARDFWIKPFKSRSVRLSLEQHAA